MSTKPQEKGTMAANHSTLFEDQLLYINGSFCQSKTNKTFSIHNPMTGKQLYQCAAASIDDYAAAIDHAHTSFKTWSATPPSERRRIFLKAADILESFMTRDAPEILSAEVSAVKSWVNINVRVAAGMLRDSAGLVDHIKGEVIPVDRPGTTVLVKRCPVGVVFAMSPWNAPMNLTARSIATPLICGDTVIVKPSEFSPKSQFLVVRALIEAGLPRGCIHYLPTSPEDAPTITEYAVKHHRVLRVNFTGSDRVGRIIAGIASTELKQCVLELGGKSPVLICEDANLEDAVEAVVFGAFCNSGQICMSTERVFVHCDVVDEFKRLLVERIDALNCGNHLEDDDVSVSGLFNPSSATRVLHLIEDALKSGAKLVVGNLQISGPNQTILRPHVVEDVTPAMEIFHKETFGPVFVMATFKTDDEAVELANKSDFSLSASIFSRDIMRATELTDRIRTGSCHINGPTVYLEPSLPHGGTGGSSGYGRFGGVSGIDQFTEKKIISLAHSGARYTF